MTASAMARPQPPSRPTPTSATTMSQRHSTQATHTHVACTMRQKDRVRSLRGRPLARLVQARIRFFVASCPESMLTRFVCNLCSVAIRTSGSAATRASLRTRLAVSPSATRACSSARRISMARMRRGSRDRIREAPAEDTSAPRSATTTRTGSRPSVRGATATDSLAENLLADIHMCFASWP